MILKRSAKKHFCILLTIFAVVNIFLLKNLIKYSFSTASFNYQLSFDAQQNLIISLEANSTGAEAATGFCHTFDEFHTHLNSVQSRISLNNPQTCVNYLSANGVRQEEWVSIELDSQTNFSYFLYSYEYLNANGIRIEHCDYASISWGKDDFAYKLSVKVRFSNGSRVLNERAEFFYISCESTSKKQYETVYARILSRNKAPPKERPPINVLMLGLDSVSRKLWLDALPQSSNYLLNGDLKAKLLTSYNIVGDGNYEKINHPRNQRVTSCLCFINGTSTLIRSVIRGFFTIYKNHVSNFISNLYIKKNTNFMRKRNLLLLISRNYFGVEINQ